MGDEVQTLRPSNAAGTRDAEGLEEVTDLLQTWESPPRQPGEISHRISHHFTQMEQVLCSLIIKHLEPVSQFSQQLAGLRKEMSRFWEELPAKSEMTKLRMENEQLRKSISSSDATLSSSRPTGVGGSSQSEHRPTWPSAVDPPCSRPEAVVMPSVGSAGRFTFQNDDSTTTQSSVKAAWAFPTPAVPAERQVTVRAPQFAAEVLEVHEDLPGQNNTPESDNIQSSGFERGGVFQSKSSAYSASRATESTDAGFSIVPASWTTTAFSDRAGDSLMCGEASIATVLTEVPEKKTCFNLSAVEEKEITTNPDFYRFVGETEENRKTFAPPLTASARLESCINRNNRRTNIAQVVGGLHGQAQAKRSKTSENHFSLWPKANIFEQDAEAKDAAPKAVFADVNAMKDKLRENLGKPKYDVANFYWKTGWCQAIARASWFENLTLFIIALNAIWLAIDTEYNDSPVITQASPFFQIGENVFCVYFTFEWVIRFASFERKRNCLKDAWLVFDASLVFMMVGETWIMYLIFSFQSSDSGGLGNTSIVRLVRLLRLTRMARMAKLLVAMPELNILIKGITVACRSVFFTLVLLVVIIYMFGIAFTQLMVDTPPGKKYFSGLSQSMMTLLLHATFLDDLPTVVRRVGAESMFYGAMLLLFVLIASLTVMNMLIGILCEVVSVVSAIEKEACMLNFVKERMQQMLTDSGLDSDGDGMISKVEFEKLIEIPEAAQALQEVGVDVLGLVDSSDFIFGVNGEIELSFQDFMDVVLELRGSNSATVKDIVDLRKFFLQELSLVEEKVAKRIIEDSHY